jgi:hypothetical protein
MTFSGFRRSSPADAGSGGWGDASWSSGVDGGAMTARNVFVATLAHAASPHCDLGRKQSH